jgi:hypothetical protein
MPAKRRGSAFWCCQPPASDHLLLAMNAICRCQAGQKSDHGVKAAGNLANVGSEEENIMAKVDARQGWSKQELLYKFQDVRDFGWTSTNGNMTQEGIESQFEAACNKWAPDCGLTFRKVQDNPDILVKWSRLGKNDNGELKGGETSGHRYPTIITFSDDVPWTATALDPNWSNFSDVALHEMGHAVGMLHSSDDTAVMYWRLEKHTRSIGRISPDDAVGARYLYRQTPLDEEILKTMLLVNETNDATITYSVYVTNDSDMKISLGYGSINPSELTYWKERMDLFNQKRLYRVNIQCNGRSFITDNIPPQAQVSFFKDGISGNLGVSVVGDRWGDTNISSFRPPFKVRAVCACRQGGPRTQLWGVDQQGLLHSTVQVSPTGGWSTWSGDDASPGNLVDLTAAQQYSGRVQLWVLTSDGTLHSKFQTSSGDWGVWSADWNGAPKFTRICACLQGDGRVQLWGVDKKGLLHSTFQVERDGNWWAWSGDDASPGNLVDLTAAQQNNGRVQLWVLTDVGDLRSNYQTGSGGNWYGWSPGNWNGAPKFTRICACLQGDGRVQLWGVDKKGLLQSTFQVERDGNWWAWSGDDASPGNLVDIAAVQQNNGRVQLWVLTPDGKLHSSGQTRPGGDWSGWLS